MDRVEAVFGSPAAIRSRRASLPATWRNALPCNCATATGSIRRCRLCSTICRLARAAPGNIAALVRVCGVDAEDVAEMITEIRSLDPRPGLAFDPPLAQPVVPDILMRAQPEGGWIVELNAETLPRVLVNNRYYARVREATRSKAEKDYLTERLQAANWLVKSLHQRATTILKVAAEIVRQQDAFFRHGVQSLRPLILRDIADAIGMHESTVSRVTSNKYMATPRGLYELKYFFTSSIPARRRRTARIRRKRCAIASAA